MASMADDIVIRPVCLQDAEALWAIARQEGVIETPYHSQPFMRYNERNLLSDTQRSAISWQK
jgi:hypothetical protein